MAIRVQRGANRVEVSFQDNGPGISAQDPNRIFERFYTDREGEDSFGQNSGLGLSISRQIVEAHGGALVVKNTKDKSGKVVGACFVASFPALSASGGKA